MLSEAKDDRSQPMLKNYGHLLPPTKFIAPELEGGSKTPTFATDAWGFGCLVYSVYNGSKTTIQFENRGEIPLPLFRHVKALVNPNPSSRLDISKFLQLTSLQSAYFDDPFISTSLFLEQFALKDKAEKERFLM